MVIVAVCVVLAVVIAGLQMRGGKGGFDAKEKMWIICGNGQCGEKFQITAQEYTDFVAKNLNAMGQLGNKGYTCPKCGKDSGLAAVQCEKCQNVFKAGAAGPGAFPDQCPKCGYSKSAGR